MSRAVAGCALMAVLAALLICAPLGAAPLAPEARRPPDPREGERLDGRAAPKDPYRVALFVPRALLAAPRAVFRFLFAPIVAVSEETEERKLYDRLYWATTSWDQQSGVRPNLSYRNNVLGVGLRYFNHRLLGPGSTVEVAGRVGWTHELAGELVIAPRPRLALTARVERFDDLRFAGTHGESDGELRAAGRDVARFGMQRAFLEVGHEASLGGPLRLGLRGQLDVASFMNGVALGGDRPIADVWDTRAIPGFSDGLRRVRGGTTLSYDTLAPYRFQTGVRLSLDGLLAQGFAGDDSRDVRFVAEAHAPVAFGDRAVVFGAAAGMMEELGDTPVPFYDLLSPTDGQGLRGEAAGRLRGASMARVSLEYRWLAATYLDASVFVDYGGAFDEGFDNFDVARFVPTVGVGLTGYPDHNRYWQTHALGALYLAYSFDVEAISLVLVAGE